MNDNDLDRYDHDLVELLEVLQRIDLKQFASDLKINDRKLFDNLISVLNKEKDVAHRS